MLVSIRSIKGQGADNTQNLCIKTGSRMRLKTVDYVWKVVDEYPTRWYPHDGKLRVVVLFDRPFDYYDSQRWQVEDEAWDHEHCDRCDADIPAMELCWVTWEDPYVLLCDECHAEVAAAARAGG